MRPGLLWITSTAAQNAPALRERLESQGLGVSAHVLSPVALVSDRPALTELDRALEALRRQSDLDPERVAVLGIARAGTLAFLLGCTRRVAAVVDVGGPVLYAALSAERPAQPLELALNFEGAFLGLFARGGAVGEEERALLGARLTAAARPHEIVLHECGGEGGEGLFDPRASGYDARRAEELAERVCAFLAEHLAESD